MGWGKGPGRTVVWGSGQWVAVQGGVEELGVHGIGYEVNANALYLLLTMGERDVACIYTASARTHQSSTHQSLTCRLLDLTL